MFRRLLAIMLCLAMLSAVLISCGSGSSNGDADQDQPDMIQLAS
jgi:hypothetical protein